MPNGGAIVRGNVWAGCYWPWSSPPRPPQKQFGKSSNFSQIGRGVILSTGSAVDTTGPCNAADLPSTDMGQSCAPKLDAYNPGQFANFNGSLDAARLQVQFPPLQTSAWKRVMYDAANNPVDVSTSFVKQWITIDTVTAVDAPHGLIGTLRTATGLLSAVSHPLLRLGFVSVDVSAGSATVWRNRPSTDAASRSEFGKADTPLEESGGVPPAP